MSFEDNSKLIFWVLNQKLGAHTTYKEGLQEYSLSILLVISPIRKDQVLMVVAH